MNRCPHFTTCSAPLCPEDPASLERAVWYPGEEICKRHGVDFALRQRRIARARVGSETCFTALMLRRKLRVTKSLRGLNPERDRAEALRAWLKEHQGAHTPSPEVTEERAARMRGIRGRKRVPMLAQDDKN